MILVHRDHPKFATRFEIPLRGHRAIPVFARSRAIAIADVVIKRIKMLAIDDIDGNAPT